jgi:hypothetical protein
MIIDLRKMDEITPKGCQGLLTRIMPSLRNYKLRNISEEIK